MQATQAKFKYGDLVEDKSIVSNPREIMQIISDGYLNYEGKRKYVCRRPNTDDMAYYYSEEDLILVKYISIIGKECNASNASEV